MHMTVPERCALSVVYLSLVLRTNKT